MDTDESRKQLRAVLERLECDYQSIDEGFEKLIVATTNIFRLMDGQTKTLLALQGSPKELQGYVLNLISEIRKMTAESGEKVSSNLKKTIMQLEKE